MLILTYMFLLKMKVLQQGVLCSVSRLDMGNVTSKQTVMKLKYERMTLAIATIFIVIKMK